jgi:hypothetical protein
MLRIRLGKTGADFLNYAGNNLVVNDAVVDN